MTEHDLLILLLNSGLYLITFLLVLKRRGFDVVSFIFCLYFFLSLMSIGLYLHPMSYSTYDDLNIGGFFLLYLGIVCFTMPLFSIKKEITIVPPREDVFNLIILVLFFLSLSRLPSAISHMRSGLFQMIIDPSGFEEVYRDRMDVFVRGGSIARRSISLLSMMYGIAGDTAVFLYVYYQTVHYRKSIQSLGLLISSVIILFSYVSDAERGGIARVILIFAFSYLLFKDKIDTTIRKRVKWALISIIAILIVFLSAITISRFSNKSYYGDNYVSYSVMSYLGQPMLNYDKFVISEPNTREGERTAALVKTIFQPGGRPYNYSRRVSKYSYMSIDESSFSTFLGDLSLDYGPFVTAIICIIFAMASLLSFSNKKEHRFRWFLLKYIVLYIVICGWYLFPFSDVGGNLKLLFNLLLVMII